MSQDTPTDPSFQSEHWVDEHRANNQIWDAYYGGYQQGSVVPGVKYPNEHLVRFMASLPSDDRPSDATVLEVGFGNITNMLMMRSFGYRVRGLEVSISAVERAREAISQRGLESEIQVAAFDGGTLPIETGSVDIVVALQCIYYNLDQSLIAQECARVLKPGGRLFLSFFTPRHQYMEFIVGEPGGVVQFDDKHPNPSLRGLKLFLFGSKEQLRAEYARYFNVQVGRIEDETIPLFQSWWYLTGQRTDGATAVATEISERPQEPAPRTGDGPENLLEIQLSNARLWENKDQIAYESNDSPGNRYPNETLVRFLATRQRRTLDTFFKNRGTEDQTSGAGDGILELMPINTVNLQMAAGLSYSPSGLSWSGTVVESGRRALEQAGLRESVSLAQLSPGKSFPFEDASFQLIMSEKFGSHMPDQEQLVQETSRVLKPGGEIMIGYLAPNHGYVDWCEPLGADYYRITDEHPDPTMRGLVLFMPGKDRLKSIWGMRFDVEVRNVESDLHRYFSSFHYVTGEKRGE